MASSLCLCSSHWPMSSDSGVQMCISSPVSILHSRLTELPTRCVLLNVPLGSYNKHIHTFPSSSTPFTSAYSGQTPGDHPRPLLFPATQACWQPASTEGEQIHIPIAFQIDFFFYPSCFNPDTRYFSTGSPQQTPNCPPCLRPISIPYPQILPSH